MACCILLAAIVAQLIAFWKTRGKRIFFLGGSVVTLLLFSWQLTAHWHHLSAIGAQTVALFIAPDTSDLALIEANQVVCSTPKSSNTITSDVQFSFVNPASDDQPNL